VEPKVLEEEEEEQRKSHKHIEECRQRLAKLLFDGTQMVTNIQVAADLREMQRRAEEAELKLQRVEKLENEAKSSTYKFEEITSKWALAKEMRIPQELWQLLNQQQQQCALLLEEKNKLIGELQQELKNKDEQYVQAIKKQSDDIHLLLERMEEQIRLMLKTYRHKLLQIEKTFELERRELLDNNRKKWEEAMQAHNAQELEYLHARMRKVEEFEKQLNQLLVQDEEDYHSMKIQLENDVQNLERQLQQMKAVYQLTQEKLEYNLQVLKKQDEENTVIRSQQKRKLNRLHSLLKNLRTKLANQEKQFREENQSLADDCERITGQCKEVQRRMRHFAISDAEKFTEVWLMNEEEAKGLMRKALDADRLIHTQQLGLPWEEPHYWFLNNVGPLGRYNAKRMATKLAAEVLTGGMHSVLVTPALEIHTEDDLYQLLDFFLKYKAQEVAASQVGPPGTAVGRAQQSQGSREGRAEHLNTPESRSSVLTLKCFPVAGQGREKDGSSKEVLPVRDSSKDGEYWEALTHVIPEPTLKLWDALAVALEEYYKILTRRANLLAETAALRQETSELRRLLGGYLRSRVSVAASSSPAAWGHPPLCVPHPCRSPKHGDHCLEPISVRLFSLQVNK
uniref:Dynein regulatory complex protein 1 n=1 Tax=Strix occidentalis caurina TaxID=311401 RepID=A0A8D0FY16_STROC